MEKTYFAGHTFEYKWKTKQKAQNRKCKVEMHNERWRSPPSRNNLGRAPPGKGSRPTKNRPCKGGHEAGLPGCGSTLGAAAPSPSPLGPMSSGGCMPPCIGGFGQFPILLVPNRPHSTIKEGVELSFTTHIIWSYTPHYPTLVVF